MNFRLKETLITKIDESRPGFRQSCKLVSKGDQDIFCPAPALHAGDPPPPPHLHQQHLPHRHRRPYFLIIIINNFTTAGDNFGY